MQKEGGDLKAGSMALQPLLKEKREALLKKWFEQSIQSYPTQTVEFLNSNRGQFTNPVGYSLRQGLGSLYDELCGDRDPEKIREALDSIIRIRAVQDFSPSEAVSFVFLLKDIISKEIGERVSVNELNSINEEIDRTALTAFDVYMQCREDLFEVRIREVERRNFRLLQVANQIFELRGEQSLLHTQQDSQIEQEKR